MTFLGYALVAVVFPCTVLVAGYALVVAADDLHAWLLARAARRAELEATRRSFPSRTQGRW